VQVRVISELIENMIKMKIPILILFLIIHLSDLTFTQKLNWKHLNGPMGGIVGGMDINSNGDIYAGVYPFMTAYYTGLYKSTDNGDNWDKIQTQFADFCNASEGKGIS
jgi:hypothetical protein